MKKILVTGVDGFIFSNFVRNFNLKNYQLILLDKQAKFNKDLFLNNKSYVCDITSYHGIKSLFDHEKPEFVIHGAAESAVDASISDPVLFSKSNVVGTQVLIDCAVKSGVEKFVYISTDEVMGHLPDNESDGFDETKELEPRNPYSASKAAGELLLQAAHNTYGIKYNITRSSNNYGPGQTPNKLVPKVIKCILNNKDIPVFGEGKQVRDWTHVSDNCAAVIKILLDGKPNEIYNISANQEHTNIDVVKSVCDYMGKGHNLIKHIPDPRPGHDFRYSVKSDKLRKLGWEPKINFMKDVGPQCIDWYLNTNLLNSYGEII